MHTHATLAISTLKKALAPITDQIRRYLIPYHSFPHAHHHFELDNRVCLPNKIGLPRLVCTVQAESRGGIALLHIHTLSPGIFTVEGKHNRVSETRNISTSTSIKKKKNTLYHNLKQKDGTWYEHVFKTIRTVRYFPLKMLC